MPYTFNIPHRLIKRSATSSRLYVAALPIRSLPQIQTMSTAKSTEPNPPPIKLTTHTQYTSGRLLPASLPPNPIALFQQWFTSALRPESDIPAVREPEAMSIATVSPEGVPSVRTVLLKTVDERGFVFYTNYESRKSGEMAAGWAAGNLYWREVSRQVRFVGRVEKVR